MRAASSRLRYRIRCWNSSQRNMAGEDRCRGLPHSGSAISPSHGLRTLSLSIRYYDSRIPTRTTVQESAAEAVHSTQIGESIRHCVSCWWAWVHPGRNCRQTLCSGPGVDGVKAISMSEPYSNQALSRYEAANTGMWFAAQSPL